MKRTPGQVSRLMLERYRLGEVSEEERKFVMAALSSDTEMPLRYEVLNNSDIELRSRYPLENLPRLAGFRHAAIPFPKTRTKIIWGLCAAALILCALFPVLYFSKWNRSNKTNETIIVQSPTQESDEQEEDNELWNEDHGSVGAIAEIPPIVEPDTVEPQPSFRGPDRSSLNRPTPQFPAANIDDGLRQNDIAIPAGVTVIEDRRYVNNRLTGVTIPDSVTSIGEDSFANNRLSGVIIPRGVTSIGNGAFRNNQLTSIVISDSVAFIGGRAFENNLLSGVTIPGSVTYIGDGAFYSNRLTSVTIGANVSINDAIPGNFADAYNNNGRTAGTYTRSDTSSVIWIKN